MALAIAALLLQIPAIPQNSSSTVSKASGEIIREAVPNASAKPNADAPTVSSDRTEAGDQPIAPESRTSGESSHVSDVPSEVAVMPSSFIRSCVFIWI
jgi:hypothetical protein